MPCNNFNFSSIMETPTGILEVPATDRYI
jgi:hypothetical protein